MKQKDYAVIFASAGFATLAAVLIANFTFGGPTDNQTSVKVLDPITSAFEPPEETYFNKDSVNPTQTIQIKPSDNQEPFKQ